MQSTISGRSDKDTWSIRSRKSGQIGYMKSHFSPFFDHFTLENEICSPGSENEFCRSFSSIGIFWHFGSPCFRHPCEHTANTYTSHTLLCLICLTRVTHRLGVFTHPNFKTIRWCCIGNDDVLSLYHCPFCLICLTRVTHRLDGFSIIPTLKQ